MQPKDQPRPGHSATLPPIPFTLAPIIPVGEVLELPGELGRAMWASAVRCTQGSAANPHRAGAGL